MKPSTPFLLAALGSMVLGSCTTGQARDASTPKAQNELAEALAGRVPGPAVRCIRNYRTTNMRIIDDYTLLFDEGRTIYLQKPPNGCFGLGNRSRTLVTRPFGTNDLCEGDINKLVDLTAGIQGGACVFGPFVPYTKTKS